MSKKSFSREEAKILRKAKKLIQDVAEPDDVVTHVRRAVREISQDFNLNAPPRKKK
ncbi:MAG: hypothetical protein HY655_07300 [Acidobacteria bacterium]|nr:hypothetical protein [Acidobacteriota bacterium]